MSFIGGNSTYSVFSQKFETQIISFSDLLSWEKIQFPFFFGRCCRNFFNPQKTVLLAILLYHNPFSSILSISPILALWILIFFQYFIFFIPLFVSISLSLFVLFLSFFHSQLTLFFFCWSFFITFFHLLSVFSFWIQKTAFFPFFLF